MVDLVEMHMGSPEITQIILLYFKDKQCRLKDNYL